MLTVIAAVALIGAAPRPQRIVSLDLCADQFLAPLADPGQIAALSRWARDPNLSTVWKQAKALPVSGGSAEEVLALHPDLVITGPFGGQSIKPLLPAHVRILELPDAPTGPQIEANARLVAGAIGRPARGAAMVERMRAALARLGKQAPGRGRVAAYYQRRGYVTGTGTLVDDLMRRAGLVNLATRLHLGPLARVPLEAMVAARPDFLILEGDPAHATDQGSRMLDHPALARAVPPSHRIVLPARFTTCGGPGYPQALAVLEAGIKRADAGGR